MKRNGPAYALYSAFSVKPTRKASTVAASDSVENARPNGSLSSRAVLALCTILQAPQVKSCYKQSKASK